LYSPFFGCFALFTIGRVSSDLENQESYQRQDSERRRKGGIIIIILVEKNEVGDNIPRQHWIGLDWIPTPPHHTHIGFSRALQLECSKKLPLQTQLCHLQHEKHQKNYTVPNKKQRVCHIVALPFTLKSIIR